MLFRAERELARAERGRDATEDALVCFWLGDCFFEECFLALAVVCFGDGFAGAERGDCGWD